MDLLELAERVEGAAGPDRELDCAIAVAALGFFELASKWEGGPVGYGYTDNDGAEVRPGHGGDQLVPRFTFSLDAAMTLVPEGWQCERMTFWAGCGSLCTLIETHLVDGEWVREAGWLGRVEGDAANPALALTAASLRALASMEAPNAR
jgi:hypothetical protein